MANASPVPPPRTQQWRALAIAALVGFLIGVLPTLVALYQARSAAADLRQRLHLIDLENHLARSAVLARQADYPGARDAASAFFNAASTEIQGGNASRERAEALRGLLAERDDVITLLARGDPAGGDKVAAMFMTYRSAPVQ